MSSFVQTDGWTDGETTVEVVGPQPKLRASRCLPISGDSAENDKMIENVH